MIKRESKFQTLFNKYLREVKIPGHFELKQTTHNSFNMNSFEPHQLDSLMALEEGHFIWKHSDADPRKKPADCMCIPPLPAYVVILYSLNNLFVMIRIDDFLSEKNSVKTCGLTVKRAQEIAERVVKM